MSIVEDREQVHQDDMFTFLGDAAGPARERPALSSISIVRKIETDPILNLVIVHDEVAHLTRKLGPERFVKSQERDARVYRRSDAALAPVDGRRRQAGRAAEPDDDHARARRPARPDGG